MEKKRNSNLKMKILWFFKNINDSITIEDLDLIEVAMFDECGELVFKHELTRRYQKYWEDLLAKRKD